MFGHAAHGSLCYVDAFVAWIDGIPLGYNLIDLLQLMLPMHVTIVSDWMSEKRRRRLPDVLRDAGGRRMCECQPGYCSASLP